jgi:succinoglycan biosynthesis transport protein ExoP
VRHAADEAAPPRQPSAAASPSLLNTPNRSARVSTSRYAEPRSEGAARPAKSLLSSAPADTPSHPESAGPGEARQEAPRRKAAPDRERFGDRISRLIGTIAPEAKPAEPQPADAGEPAEPPEPVRPAEHQQQASTPRRPRFEAGPEAAAQTWPEHAYRPGEGHSNGDDHYHWHAASAGGQFEDGNRPLLDASILISAVWRFRRLIAAATVAGAVIGVLMALSTPHMYYAESRLFVDPREIRVTEDDIRNQQLSTEAMLAITDSQLQILSSTSVLEKVIEDLGLDRDPEFNGSMAPGGISGGISLIRELFTGKNPATEGEQKALNNLREALSVGRDARTFVIIVGVDTRDPEKSALIANQIVETYLDSEGQAQSSLLERTSESIDTRLNSLRADLDAAEREVERFKAENGLVGVGGQYIDDKEILALSDQLANARAMKVGIRVKADNLARVKIDDVLSGAFPEELLSNNLSELRKQYAQTKSNAESLATRLGPRHPQYISAMQSLETITNEISAELRRIVASSQTELQRAVETEQELASQMAVAKSRAIDQSVELVTLRELERKANATRGIYEAFLTRSRETSERSNLSTRNVRVISPAEAPLQPMGPSRKFIAIGGMIAGFLAGFGLALLAGAVESIRAYNSALHQARYPGPAAGNYPQPPAPGPRTPPTGPGQRFRPRGESGMAGRDSGPAGTPEPAFSGARAHHDAETPVARQARTADAGPAFRDVFRIGLLRPRAIRGKPSVSASGDGSHQRGETAASHHGNGRNAQAFFATHGQPHDPATPEAFQGGGQFGMQRNQQGQQHNPEGTQPVWAPRPGQPGSYMQPQMPESYPPQPPLNPSTRPMRSTSARRKTSRSLRCRRTLTTRHPITRPIRFSPIRRPMRARSPVTLLSRRSIPIRGSRCRACRFRRRSFIRSRSSRHALAVAAISSAAAALRAGLRLGASRGSCCQRPATARASSRRGRARPRPAARDTASVDRIRREMDELRSRIDGYSSDRRRA